MQVTIGKHAGKSLELLILKEPGYVHWLLDESPSGVLLAMKQHAQSLIKKFDAKPFQRVCHVQTCSLPATHATVYGNSLSPYWWCETCNPYQSGANDGKLQGIKTYSQALSHVEFYCASRKADYVELIKYLGEAKGLSARVGEKQAMAFFA